MGQRKQIQADPQQAVITCIQDTREDGKMFLP